MADFTVRTVGLGKRYADRWAVEALDLEVARGEVFGLLGPNGAGKTTTILMLLGLVDPTVGDVEVMGLDPRRHPLEVKRQVGYVPDAVGFHDDLTGRQNLRFTAALNGLVEADARIELLLDRVGLAAAADQPAGTYSRGMRQRLGLADALLKSPRVLILDEPTTAIDPEGVAEVLTLLRSLADDHGVTVLLSSHALNQVQAVCDRVAIFVDGAVVAEGTPMELAGKNERRRVEVTFADAAPDPSMLPTFPTWEATNRPDTLVAVLGPDDHPTLNRALVDAGFEIVGLRRLDTDLEHIYRRYFANEVTHA